MAEQVTNGKDVNAKEFADLLGISRARVSQHLKDGMPAKNSGRKGAPVQINTAVAIAWLIERKTEQKTGKGESQRERLYREQADEKALANERERGKLIYRDQVRDVLMLIAQSLASALDGLAGRLANELSHQDARYIRERLLAEHRLVRLDVARAGAEFVIAHGGDDPLRDTDAAAAGKDARPVGRRKSKTAKRKRRTRKVAKR